MNIEPELLVGLDLGTSKIAVVVAERGSQDSEAQIIGVGQAPSLGIRKGLIVNLEQAVIAVRNAVEDAQHMVGLNLDHVTVAFSGTGVQSTLSRGMISLGRTPRQVTQEDISRVIEVAQSEVDFSGHHCVLHAIPVAFTLDGHDGIDDPLGMTGGRLEIELQSVIIPTSTFQNVVHCVEKAGLTVDALVIKPLASALGALSSEESNSGAAVIDFGGGTTGVAIFNEGRARRLMVVPVGGDHLTNDLACVLRIPTSKAEALKKEVALLESPDSLEDKLEFELRGQNFSFTVKQVVEIMTCRVEELFQSLVGREFAKSGVSMFPAGIILSGGASKTGEMESFVSGILDLPVRLGIPVDSNKMPPGRNGIEYTASSGVIRYILEKEKNPYWFIEPSTDMLRNREKPSHPTSGRIPITGGGTKTPSRSKIPGILETIKRSFRELF